MSGAKEALEKLAEGMERKLQTNPLFREWMTVKRAIDELGANVAAVQKPPRSDAFLQVAKGRVTCASAATAALEDAGRPLATRELLELLPKYGFTVGGSKDKARKDPASSLASMLAGRNGNTPFHSIYINNRPYWWFKDRAVPTLTGVFK